jgi:hypothetical protein
VSRSDRRILHVRRRIKSAISRRDRKKSAVELHTLWSRLLHWGEWVYISRLTLHVLSAKPGSATQGPDNKGPQGDTGALGVDHGYWEPHTDIHQLGDHATRTLVVGY